MILRTWPGKSWNSRELLILGGLKIWKNLDLVRPKLEYLEYVEYKQYAQIVEFTICNMLSC